METVERKASAANQAGRKGIATPQDELDTGIGPPENEEPPENNRAAIEAAWEKLQSAEHQDDESEFDEEDEEEQPSPAEDKPVDTDQAEAQESESATADKGEPQEEETDKTEESEPEGESEPKPQFKYKDHASAEEGARNAERRMHEATNELAKTRQLLTEATKTIEAFKSLFQQGQQQQPDQGGTQAKVQDDATPSIEDLTEQFLVDPNEFVKGLVGLIEKAPKQAFAQFQAEQRMAEIQRRHQETSKRIEETMGSYFNEHYGHLKLYEPIIEARSNHLIGRIVKASQEGRLTEEDNALLETLRNDPERFVDKLIEASMPDIKKIEAAFKNNQSQTETRRRLSGAHTFAPNAGNMGKDSSSEEEQSPRDYLKERLKRTQRTLSGGL